ncbi:MAG TPA: hypothetical protein VK470_09135 [Bacteroidota bacterium]|nr:hypothetical protein [Bacteroidota bacterium]
MEKQSSRFYDIRFGILIAIIVLILLFKYFSGHSLKVSQAQPFSSSTTVLQVHPRVTLS